MSKVIVSWSLLRYRRSRGEAEPGRTCGAVFFSEEFLRKESRECHQVSRFSVVSSDGVKGSAYGYKM